MTQRPDAEAGPGDVDWDGWATPLRRFSAATGLCVSAYDQRGARRIGPLCSSKVASVLASTGIWEEGGAGHQLERALAARVLAEGRLESETLCGELCLQAAPLTYAQGVRGAVVYGWVFTSFATPLGCDRIGRQLGVDGTALWAQARVESPVPAARMSIYTELLQTMIASVARDAEAMHQLQELSRLREVFLAGVSHELRTPLSALGTRIELLLRGGFDDPAAARAALLQMKQHVATEARLVEDLIEASRTRTGQLSIRKTAASLAAILSNAIASVQPHAEAKAVSLRVPALAALAAMPIMADAQRLQQVFWNLLSNAVKFTAPGGSVELRIEDRSSAYQVAIADSGRGIDAALLPHIFDPFTKRRDDNEQGLGLGLSIARYIVEQHGGTIRVESAGADSGATFQVTLPKIAAG